MSTKQSRKGARSRFDRRKNSERRQPTSSKLMSEQVPANWQVHSDSSFTNYFKVTHEPTAQISLSVSTPRWYLGGAQFTAESRTACNATAIPIPWAHAVCWRSCKPPSPVWSMHSLSREPWGPIPGSFGEEGRQDQGRKGTWPHCRLYWWPLYCP